MSKSVKNGICPICQTYVRRQGQRNKDNVRTNLICWHYFNQKVCTGSGLKWDQVLRYHVHYETTIEEIPTNGLLTV